MIKLGLISLGAKQFNIKIAKKNLNTSYKLLKNIDDTEIVYSPNIICDNNALESQLDDFQNQKIDLLVVQAGTFFMGDMCIQILKRFPHLPLLIWGIEEPEKSENKKVELNSWTGLNLFSSILNRYNKTFSYVYGNVEDEKIINKIRYTIKAINLKKYLNDIKLGCIGSRVPGFYFSEADQIELLKNVGPEVEYYDIETVFSLTKQITSQEINEVLQTLKNKKIEVCVTNEEMTKTIKLFLACKKLCENEGLSGLSLRCWPELQERYNMAGCGAISLLVNDGIMTSCESDIPGLITMIIQNNLTNKTPFFTDLVNFTKDNLMTAWHCGQAPICLGCGKTCFVKQPTFSQRYTTSVQTTLKTGKVSINKLSLKGKNIRMFSAYGEAILPIQNLDGSQMDICLDKNKDDLIKTIVENGIEHHYSVIHEDLKEQILECCKWLDWSYIE